MLLEQSKTTYGMKSSPTPNICRKVKWKFGAPRRPSPGGTYVVSFAAELPEGLDIEPGTLVPGRVQGNPHGVLLQQRRKALVHRQELVALNVKELRQTNQVDQYYLDKSINNESKKKWF